MSLTELMSAAGLSTLPTIALVLFLAVFVAVLLRVLPRKYRRTQDEAARLPLCEAPRSCGIDSSTQPPGPWHGAGGDA